MTDTTSSAFEVVRAAVASVATDQALPLVGIDPDVDLWRALDLDSLDHLTAMTQIAETTGVDIAERDYPRLISLRQLCDHVDQTMQ